MTMRRASPTIPPLFSPAPSGMRRVNFRLAVWVTAAAGAICSACAAASAEEPAPPREASKESSPRDETPLELEAQPHHLRINSRVNFTEDGFATFARDDFRMNIRITAKTSLGVLAYRVLETPVTVTNSGEKVRIRNYAPDDLARSRIRQNDKQRDRFQISLRGTPPTVPAKTLERVTARIELQMGRDPDGAHEFGPIEDLVDTTIEIPGVEGCTLSVKKQRSRYRVEYSGDAWKRVKHVAYVRNNGETGRNARLSNIRHRTQEGNVYSDLGNPVTKSNEGKIVVQFWKDVILREARIELRDVPLRDDPEDDE